MVYCIWFLQQEVWTIPKWEILTFQFNLLSISEGRVSCESLA